jgi:hypothetical protein
MRPCPASKRKASLRTICTISRERPRTDCKRGTNPQTMGT